MSILRSQTRATNPELRVDLDSLTEQFSSFSHDIRLVYVTGTILNGIIPIYNMATELWDAQVLDILTIPGSEFTASGLLVRWDGSGFKPYYADCGMGVAEITADYTLIPEDFGKEFVVIGGACIITIPAGLPVGFACSFVCGDRHASFDLTPDVSVTLNGSGSVISTSALTPAPAESHMATHRAVIWRLPLAALRRSAR